MKGTSIPINSKVMESFIKSTHIFDNVNIASRPCIIKISPKSNMVIVWIDIWDSQSSSTVVVTTGHKVQ